MIAFDLGELIGGPAEGDEGFNGVTRAAETAKQLCAGQGEAGRQDADDSVGAAVEWNSAADDPGIGGEAATPETCGEKDDIVAGLLFCGKEGAAEHGMDAEEREEIGRVLGYANLLRLAAAEGQGFVSDGSEALKRFRVLPPVEQMVGVDRHVHVGSLSGKNVFTNDDELLRLRVIRQAKQDIAHDGEHDNVRADAEGEGKKSGRAEGRTAAQLAKCEAQFAEQPVHD